jgi:hypothetical protein
MIARSGNQVANNRAYRLRAIRHRMDDGAVAGGRVSAVISANGPEVVPGHFYSTKPAAAPLVGWVGDRSCCSLCRVTGDRKTFISAIQRATTNRAQTNIQTAGQSAFAGETGFLAGGVRGALPVVYPLESPHVTPSSSAAEDLLERHRPPGGVFIPREDG